MFQIDERIDYQRIQQFASQVSSVSKRLMVEMEENFVGDRSDDFYHGLLAGLANSFSLLQSSELSESEKQSILGALVAFVSDQIAKKGL